MKINKNDLIFLPLGGSSEIGMNSNLYHYDDNWIMVDLGISFADESMPGVDILLPDIDFIVERRDKLKGIFLTHGHEDHMGAIQYIWEKLRVPIYGSSFTIALLKKKLKENPYAIVFSAQKGNIQNRCCTSQRSWRCTCTAAP